MSLKAILNAVKKNKTFVVTTHVGPDIDGLASQLVMALFLKSKGKKVCAISNEEIPRMYQFLPYSHLIKKYDGKQIHCDVAIVVDCGDLHRIEKIKNVVHKAKILINIDHHVTNRSFGDLNLVRPKASSTAEVLFELLKKAKYPLTKPLAELLYLGIMTDTGSFRYDNTTADTHAIVSELLTFGFSVNNLYKKIYESVPLKDFKTLTSIFSHFELSHFGQVVSVELPKGLLEKFSGEFDLREKIFSFLRAIKGIEMAVIFTESKKGLTKINFRSQGKINVAQLASFFHGGGHKKASGCQITSSIKQAKKQLFSRLHRILK